MGKLKGDAMLFVVVLIWGTCFVGVKWALELGLSPGFITMARAAINTLCCLVFFFGDVKAIKRNQLLPGLIIGALTALGFITQTEGMRYTSLSSSAFLTVTYVVIAPFISWALFKKRPSIKVYISSAACLLGTAILTGVFASSITFNLGDLLTLACALFFASQIVLISVFAVKIGVKRLTFLIALGNFACCSAYCLIAEGGAISAEAVLSGLPLLLYLGIIGSFISFTMQTYAQTLTTPTSAVVIMTLESVVTSVLSVTLNYEPFTCNLLLGGLIIIAAVLFLEIEPSRLKRPLTL